MSEDRHVDRDHPPDDIDTTAVRPALADELLEPAPYADDDLLADEEFMAPGGRRPSRLTRVLVGLLICALGIFVGVQLARLAGGSATGAAGASQSRRFGPPGQGAAGGTTPAASGSTPGSSAPAVEGEVTSVAAHRLVVADQGRQQTVTFTDATSLTATYGHGDVAVGDSVTVSGSRAADGSVNATSIVVR